MGHEVSFIEEPCDFMDHARQLIFEYVTVWFKKSDRDVTFTKDDISVYWFSKDGGDWRVLLTTTLQNDIYYQVTHFADKEETSIDVYYKYGTVTIQDKDVY
jgi:hypothetical protein